MCSFGFASIDQEGSKEGGKGGKKEWNEIEKSIYYIVTISIVL